MKKKNCVDCKFYELLTHDAFRSYYDYNCKIKGIINYYDLFGNECGEYSRKTTRQIEKQLENRCIAWARAHGWDCWKNENNGNTGIPDHSLLKGGRFLMVEFKASATARIRPEQIRWKERHPETIHFIHDFETFTKIFEK